MLYNTLLAQAEAQVDTQPTPEPTPTPQIIIQQPEVPAPSPVTGWIDGLGLLLAFVAGELAREFLANRSPHAEAASKRMAGQAATALGIAERFVPQLRATTIDNTAREILRAYAESTPVFKRKLEEKHLTPEEVADYAAAVNPQVLARAMSESKSAATKTMIELVDAVAEEVDHEVYEGLKINEAPSPVEQEALIEAQKALNEKYLQDLRKQFSKE